MGLIGLFAGEVNEISSRIAALFIPLLAASIPALAAEGDGCREECEARARAILEECIAPGGENCEARAAAKLESCVAENCEQPPAPTCEEACGAQAEEVFRAAIAEGAGEEEAQRRAQGAFEECLVRECEEPPPPPERTCEDMCETHAREVFHACLAEGNGEDICHGRRQATLEQCLQRECEEAGPLARLAVSSTQLTECGPAEVAVTLTNREPVQAFSFGVAHNSEIATLTGIDYDDCPALEGLNGGAGPAFFEADLNAWTGNCEGEIAAGGTVYCVASQEVIAGAIPPGAEQCVARLTYKLAPDAPLGTESPLPIVGCLGDDLPWRIVTTIHFESVRPETRAGALIIPKVPCSFRRGEANRDGRLDISDPVSILAYLFEDGAGPLGCEDAADVNDDGQLDIGDPIGLLNYIFAGAATPPEPFEACGPDPTDDELGCVVYVACP